ncbi:MAG: ABC transporter substrate-binding protein, partial [Acetatifactor sp.]|nr:ABC transporter substrate-binding protein [Acetatifactor sp.]
MKKKFLSVATASVLAVSMLAGCGGGDDGNASSSTPPSSDSGSTAQSEAPADSGSSAADSGSDLLPALSEAEQGKPGALSTPRSSYVQYPYADGAGVKLTYWMSVPGNVMNHADTPDSVQMTQWAQRWQELTGIEVEFQGPATTKSDEVTTAFNLMTTGSTLPDIIEWEWTSGYPGGPSQAEADGVVIWLDDLITPDGPAADLWQFLQDNPSLDTSIKTDDGHYYCFPFTRGSVMLTTTSGPVVRKDLVEAAGYKVEDLTTIDKWTEIMTAMKENGVEHPLSFESTSYMLNMMPGAWSFRSGMYVSAEDGKVHYGPMEEGYRDMLAQIKEWMDAGLIDPDSAEWTGANTKADIMNGDSAICYGALGSRM